MATAPTAQRTSAGEGARHSIEELLAMNPDGPSYELVDGRLERLSMGNRSSFIAGLFFYRLMEFVAARHLGVVLRPDSGYRMFSHRPRHVRRPDVSYVRAGRFAADVPGPAFDEIVPDIVVEVISPTDRAVRVETKLREYIEAGVGLIWVAYPETRTIRVVRPDGRTRWVISLGRVVRGDAGQVALLLRLAAVPQHGAHDVHLRMGGAGIAAAGVDLLQDDAGCAQRQAGAAILLGDEGA